jgi:hypothetical protein
MSVPSTNSPPAPPPLFQIPWKKAGLLVLCLAALLGGARLGWQQFKVISLKKTIVAAQTSLEKKDYNAAFLSAQQVLRFQPTNQVAIRVMARTAEELQSPSALFWKSRELGIENNPPEGLLQLARLALRHDAHAVAEEALNKIPEEFKKRPEYHEVAAKYYLQLRDRVSAEKHLLAAAQARPTNLLDQVNLHSFRLTAPDAAVRNNAVRELENLSKDPGLRLLCLRNLVYAYLGAGQATEAVKYSQQLVSLPSAEFQDRITFATTISVANPREWMHLVPELQREAQTNAAAAIPYIRFLNRQGVAEMAWRWGTNSGHLPLPGVSFALADSLCELKRWNELRKFCSQGSWGPLETFRQAMIYRGTKELEGQSPTTKREWERTILQADRDPQILYQLHAFAESCKWSEESEEVLWAIARGPSTQRAALQQLYRLYRDRRDTKMLYRVVARIAQLNPNDRLALNNLAILSLLLDQNVQAAAKIADHNYQLFPENLAFISTQGYALLKIGKTNEARALILKLPPEQLKSPNLSLYAGVILAECSDVKARSLLKAIPPNASFLPEEKQLLVRSLKKAEHL